MKKIISYNFLVLCLIMLVTISCNSEKGLDDNEPSVTKPEINSLKLFVNDSITDAENYAIVNEKDILKFEISLIDSRELLKLEVYHSYQMQENKITRFLEGKESIAYIDFNVPEHSVNTDYLFTFVVYNINEKTSYRTFEVQVSEKKLKSTYQGTIHHYFSEISHNAFDLSGNESFRWNPDSQIKTDIMNSNWGNFTGSFESLNSTRFLMANEYDFENATVESAKEVFLSSNSYTSNINNPKIGNIIIIFIRQSEFAVMKIDEINPDYDPDSGSNGIMKFTYKKE